MEGQPAGGRMGRRRSGEPGRTGAGASGSVLPNVWQPSAGHGTGDGGGGPRAACGPAARLGGGTSFAHWSGVWLGSMRRCKKKSEEGRLRHR